MLAMQNEIMAMAKNFPRESAALLRVAHHASKKYAQNTQELKNAMNQKEKTALEKQFNSVMTKHKSTVHAASTKAAPPQPKKTNNQHFMDALKQYRVFGGSAREKMEQIIENQKPKRRRMF